MKFTINLSYREKYFFLVLFVLLVMIGAGLSNRNPQANSIPSPPIATVQPAATPIPSAASKAQSGQVGWIVVYATPFGFEPTEVTVPAGTRVLNVQTCTGTLVAPTYRLTRPNASPLDLPQEGNDAKVELALSTGTYQLSDPANADVGSCTITVTP